MKIVYMGTPDFAVPSLENIVKAGHRVEAVFTQPDKPKGRGYTMTPPPVKVCAENLGIKVFQPSTLKDGEAYEILKNIAPDAIVVVAYGKILPKNILNLPKLGCINVHGSLLPKYRGAAPIQWAVLNGEEQTGVTTMFMSEGLDTGDMLLKSKTEIDKNETAGDLHDRLSRMGADLITETLAKLEAGELTPEKQDDEDSCYASMLDKSLCPVDWSKTAQQVHNKVRGLNPWPIAVSSVNGKKVKIYKTRVLDKHGIAGDVIDTKPLTVACGDGAVEILELQPEGKKRMTSDDFVRGYRIEKGTVFD